MNLQELESFRLSDAVKFHNHLNPALFDDEHLDPEVRKQLLVIAQDFLEHMGVSDLDVKDIVITGSNAAYTYTKHSDIDLHVIVDIESLNNDDIYRELFTAKKTVYNDSHDIKVRGYDVELYVEDSRTPAKSLGEYSVLRNRWVKHPVKRRAHFDERGSAQKFTKLAQLSQLALASDDLNAVQNLVDTVRKYRQAGLDAHGEFGPENLAYKALRSRGIVDQLYKHRDKLHGEFLSMDEDYDPNGPPPGPEFKPTMPAGTVRVDVSDVYDWYKLGQHISNLKGLGHHDFGKGPPSTIMAFGSEPEEHKYINDLKKTGLTTTDIDPVDPNQPKGMKRQKTDPTYNVNEASEEIRNYSKLDKILSKLCEMVIQGQSSDKDYGMVGACVLDPDNNIVAGLNMPGKDGKRVHAERVAIEKYEQKYGTVPEGSIVITTLSPCNETDDETALDRVGESCADYLNKKDISKVYCGYIDPTQDNDIREFNLIETCDKRIRKQCRSFADTFLKNHISEASGYIPSNSQRNDPRFKTALTVDVHPDSIKKNAKKLGLGNIQRAGIPQTANANGKFK